MQTSSVPLTQTKTESTPLLTQTSSPSLLKGHIYLFASACIYSFVSFFIHIALTRYAFSTFSSAIIRSIIPIALSAFTLSHLRPPVLSGYQTLLLAARGLLGSISLFCSYEALRRIPLAALDTIFASSPALTSLFCSIFLGERITRVEIAALITSFIGVVLVAQSSPSAEYLYGPPWVGALLAITSTVFMSAACTLVRALGTRVHAVHNVLALSLGTAVGCAIFSKGSDYEALILNRPGMAFTLLAVLLGFVGASLFNAGLQLCRAGPGLLVSTAKVPLSYLLGLWFLGEKCGTSAIVGALLIVAAAAVAGVSSAAGSESQAMTMGSTHSLERTERQRVSE